jgi:integrase
MARGSQQERRPAWVVRVWTDGDGRRKKERARPGTAWVKPDHVFLVEVWDKRTGKRTQEKIEGSGRDAKKAADKRAAEVNERMRAGTYAPPSDWSAARKQFERDALPIGRADETIADIRATLDKFERLVHPARLDRIDARLIDRYKAARLAGSEEFAAVQPSSVNREMRNLRLVFRKLRSWKLIAEVPEFEMLTEAEPDRPHYTEAEFAAMFSAADAARRPLNMPPATRRLWWQSLLLLYWESGCRRDEALQVTWEGIAAALAGDAAIEDRCATIGKTKTGKARKIYFGDETVANLRELAGEMFPGSKPSGPVFVWPFHSSQLNIDLARIQQAAGVVDRENLAFHAFRRSCGTLVAAAHGLEGARMRLGHSTIAVTQKHYAGAAVAKLTAAAAPPVPKLDRTPLRVVG